MACNKRQIALAFVALYDKYEKVQREADDLEVKLLTLQNSINILQQGFEDFERVLE